MLAAVAGGLTGIATDLIYVASFIIHHQVYAETVFTPLYNTVVWIHSHSYFTETQNPINNGMKIHQITENYISEAGMADTLKGMASRAGARVFHKAGAALGNAGHQGARRNEKISRAMFQSYKKWLGQSGAQPTVGTLVNYLTQVGVDPKIAQAAIGEGPLDLRLARGEPQAESKSARRKSSRQKPSVKNSRQDQQARAKMRAVLDQKLDRNRIFHIFGKVITQSQNQNKLPKAFKKYLEPKV